MKILLIFTLLLISGGGESKGVTGYSGGGVLIKCRYERRYISNKKYFCKGPWLNCADQIKTEVKNEWINGGRFSLFDDTRASQFWVLIRELTVEDSGTYQCGVDKILDIDFITPVQLNVQKDQDYEKSISVTGHVGGGVNISCKYPQSHKKDPKFLCRMMGSADCNNKTSLNESRRWINEGNLHLHDDGKQIFTVSFNSLTEGDSGEYWCGAESDWTSDHGYKVYITQINLRVTVPVYSVITVVLVILALLLIGLLFIMLFLRKRSKTQASTQSHPLRGASNDHRVSIAVYEEIQDIRCLPASDAGVSTVYSTARLPTNPSEPSQTVDDNDQSLSSCDFPNPAYSTLHLPSNSSD
ncbi:hypothetical protein MHYP_G00103500 [Metynnis hypsauchen]